MVVKALIDAWQSGRVMRQMYNELLQMLDACEWMFDTAEKVLFDGSDPAAPRDELYETDRLVNRAERRIRKEIVEHLTLRPQGDLPACLVLMLAAKDAERIGDYCKNLYELREMLGGPFQDDDMVRRLRKLHDETARVFDDTEKALREGGEELALRIMDSEAALAQTIEDMLREIAGSELPVRKAVVRALYLRHLRRIYAHLCNISSGVVQPVHRVDYKVKKKLPWQQEEAKDTPTA